MLGNRFQWIQYKGHRILFAEWTEIRQEADYLKAIEELEAEILKQPKGQKILTLIDQTGSIATMNINERSKRMMEAARQYGIPDSPTALVGNTGFAKAIVQALQFFRRDLHMADTIEDAKEWLIKQV